MNDMKIKVQSICERVALTPCQIYQPKLWSYYCKNCDCC